MPIVDIEPGRSRIMGALQRSQPLVCQDPSESKSNRLLYMLTSSVFALFN